MWSFAPHRQFSIPLPLTRLKRIHLLACGHCKRQLDVTALELGDEVQCVCDTVHVVGEPKLVQVRGLACGRCGGVLGEGDTSCSFCKAALAPEEREKTTLCPVCAMRLPNESNHCNRCGVSLRIAAVPAIPRGGHCPRCKEDLRVHLLEDSEVFECGSDGGCGGMWCSRETFERLMQNVRRAVHEGSVGSPKVELEPPAPQPPSYTTESYVPCLTCGELMARRQFRHEGRPSRVVIDVCRDHGVWFDKDELQAILGFIRKELTNASRIDLPQLDWASTASAGTIASSRPKRNAGPTPKRGTLTFVDDSGPLEILLDWIADFFWD